MTESTSIVARVQQEINNELADKEVKIALLATTFKGLSPVLMYQALREGMLRGFTFKEFLRRDIYALPFKNKEGDTYSIVTSIDLARKVASRTGMYFGKTAPLYEYNEDRTAIVSCTVTVKKLVQGQVGEFTATVYFDEYDQHRNLWISKPRTMIAKVAEMHALRMAFPEELAKLYVEEELDSRSRLDMAVDHPDAKELQMGEATPPDEKDDNPTEEEIIQLDEKTNNNQA